MAIFRSPDTQIRNEALDLLARGIPQVRSTAKIGGVSFNQICIELMLADQ
jgi:hypothetical protein